MDEQTTTDPGPEPQAGRHNPIWQAGCLVCTEFSCWTGRTQLPQEKIDVAAAAKRFCRGTKQKVDYDRYIRPVKSNQAAATNFLAANTVPGWRAKGRYYVPRARIPLIETRLREFMTRHVELEAEFENHWEQMIDEARAILEPDGLWDPREYPSLSEIGGHFGFRWHYEIPDLPAGANGNGILSPEMMQAEIEKNAAQVQEFGQAAVHILREEFFRAMSDLSGSLESGKLRAIKQESLDSFKNWFDKFRELNVWNDTELETLATQAKERLSQYTGEELRGNVFLREQARQMTSGFAEQVKALLDNAPTRRIVHRGPRRGPGTQPELVTD